MKQHFWSRTHQWSARIPAGCSKSPSCKAAGESKPEAYPQGYVEDFDETRTMQSGFFSILLLEFPCQPIDDHTRHLRDRFRGVL